MAAPTCDKSPSSPSAPRVGGFTDPGGDDNGPGDLRYPTNGAFNPGAFDLTGLDVFTDGADVLFVARIAGDVRNPFGGDEISLQRFNVYLGRDASGPVPALAWHEHRHRLAMERGRRRRRAL